MAKGYHHLDEGVRAQIYILRVSEKKSLREIAKRVGCHASTVSRELKRNCGQRGYRYKQAQGKAVDRRASASRVSKKLTEAVVRDVEESLKKRWSPEQISGRLKQAGTRISHETIYRHVWLNKDQGGFLYKDLRHRGKKYNKKPKGTAGRGCIPGRIDISERPAIIETKTRVGDWEGDTIIGAKHQGAIVSYVDRSTKFTILKKVDQKTASQVTQATLEAFENKGLPFHSVTYDNGKEFCDHATISERLHAPCYFARPYHSWERGLNEHTNGLVRQYLPKSTDFKEVSEEMVQSIADNLNHRPRKILGYKTPMEMMQLHLKQASQPPIVQAG